MPAQSLCAPIRQGRLGIGSRSWRIPLTGLPKANEHADPRISMYKRNVLNSADEVGGQQGSDLEQGMQIAEMCQNIRSHDSDGPSWPSDGTSWADISPGWDALGMAGIPEATGAGGLWSGCVGHDAIVAAAGPG